MRVEDVAANASHPVVNDFQILGTGVKDLDDVRILEDRRKRREILDGYGVDGDDVSACIDLNKAEAGIIGLLAEKLGVDGDDTAF